MEFERESLVARHASIDESCRNELQSRTGLSTVPEIRPTHQSEFKGWERLYQQRVLIVNKLLAIILIIFQLIVGIKITATSNMNLKAIRAKHSKNSFYSCKFDSQIMIWHRFTIRLSLQRRLNSSWGISQIFPPWHPSRNTSEYCHPVTHRESERSIHFGFVLTFCRRVSIGAN